MFLQKSDDHKDGVRPFAKVASPALISSLKQSLADAVKFYFKAHGYHWNVKGADFAQYHELFGEVYEDVYSSIDPLAEMLLKLNSDAPFRLMDFQTLSSIPDTTVSNAPNAMAVDLAQANDAMLVSLNRAFDAANSANEQGIANFVAERIDMHQKWGWQLKSSAQIAKAAPMKTEGGVQFPAEAFAYVPDPTMPSTWKLRLWDSPASKETRAQIGAAVAALGAGFRGNKVELPAADRPAVVARVRAAWKKVHSENEVMPSVLS